MDEALDAAEAGRPQVTPYLPIHVAVHFMGCASERSDGVALGSNEGAFIEYLAECVDRVTVVAYDPPESSSHREDRIDFVARPTRRNLEVLSLGRKGTWRDYHARRRRVRQIIRTASPAWDLVLFRLVNRRAELVFRANRCPRVIATLGGSVSSFLRKAEMPRVRRWLSLLSAWRSERTNREIARSAGLFFVNGETLYEKYQSITPGIRLLRSSLRREAQTYRAADRLRREEARFLAVGEVHEAKGSFDALEAFRRVRERHLPKARFDIVGSGKANEALSAVARQHGLRDCVRFRGWLHPEEVFRLYREADVLIHLSHDESLPRVIHEALAHSVLVIATRVGSVSQAFEDGRHLLLVKAGDIDGAVECIADLIRSQGLRRKLIDEGLVLSREMTLERVVGGLLHEVGIHWPEVMEAEGTVEPSESASK